MSLPYKKILVTLDGSDLAACALPHAELMAKAFTAELIVLRVIPDTPDRGMYYVPEELLQDVERYVEHQLQDWEGEVKRQLIAIAGKLDPALRISTAVELGEPAITIIDFAVQHDVDLIVMSTHGRSGLARWVYGSVAGKVLQGATTCPVLLVRAKEG